ncbi:MAG TPA: 1,2-phenylacetyl-CoA epoxidase subunit PaaC [Candidatus Limnocylindrales bacterium]|nr:1,2-phenylacetyl-CoA epoxidase subunit PaaC [Candidatus Limnocylindrales bacterium]
MTTEARLPTRQLIQPDVPQFDRRTLKPEARDALTGLLLTMADDEFVIGFRDSEWTGIAPMLEEDVAFSSIAQDEIGHARVWYEMLAQLTGDGADRLAFHRQPSEYRHARLIDQERQGWGYTITRRWLYDTADSVRLAALAESSFEPLAEVVAKVRREERYHLMHLDKWLERLATRPGTPRGKVLSALKQLAPVALSVFTPLPGEERLVEAGIIAAPMSELADRWLATVNPRLTELRLRCVPEGRPPADGRDHAVPSDAFTALWTDFTSVARLEEGVEW